MNAHELYVLEEKKRRWQIHLAQFGLFFLFIGVWEGAVRAGWINDFIFSSPSRIATTIYRMTLDGSLFLHIKITVIETLVSFGIVTLIGIASAVLLWTCTSVAKILEPYLVMLNSLPKSALAPVLIVWLGNDVKTIIVAAVSVAVFGSILTLYTSFKEMDTDLVKLIYILGGNKYSVMKYVLLPGSIPMIISNMKVNIGLCLVGVIIGEFLAAKEGLGYLIIYGSQVFQLDLVIMSIIILCVMAIGLYQIINQIEKHYSR
ncbi:Putative aliphatic sulfonates transport permease protein SsuC [Clostridiales bacterium CHKCI001]|nr:Putative aliphatic sulfonates transport permease protein SsuC [Clostridiales bacterium CHKCI001]